MGAFGCGGEHGEPLGEGSARVGALIAAGEGASDHLLLDRSEPAELTVLANEQCPEELAPEERVRCRQDLLHALTERAISADVALTAALGSSTESMTNELERRYGASRRAIIDEPITEEETEELHALWVASDEHAAPTEADIAHDEALRAEDEVAREAFEARMGVEAPR